MAEIEIKNTESSFSETHTPSSSDESTDENNLNVRENAPESSVVCSPKKCRNFTSFWIFGLCNNFAYVVMLSAAHDILKKQQKDNMTDLVPAESINSTKLIPHCNPIGTGAVLLADILPTFILKLTAPFYIQAIPYWFRVCFLVGLPAIGSFIMVAFSSAVWMSLLGVVLASVSSGIGEITFLALSSHYDRNVLSTWSSGTGGAGVFGAVSYAGLISLGVAPRVTPMIMIFIPVLLVISYFFLLTKAHTVDMAALNGSSENLLPSSGESHEQAMMKGKHLTLKEKVRLIKPLLRFMIPLGIVYFSEYFINQGLTELVEFENIWLSLDDQYRWYAVLYQVGVFISRSSVNIIRIRRIWFLAVLQTLNIGFLMLQIYLKFVPTIWIVFVFIIYEGLLGGAAYVNTFYIISEKVEEVHREYSLGVASVADSTGIVLAGLLAVPVHNCLCNQSTS